MLMTVAPSQCKSKRLYRQGLPVFLRVQTQSWLKSARRHQWTSGTYTPQCNDMQAHLVGLSEIHKDPAIVPAHSMRHLPRDVVMHKHE